jgi:hypothetical protein
MKKRKQYNDAENNHLSLTFKKVIKNLDFFKTFHN